MSQNRWGLIPVSGIEESAYICEVPKEDVRHVLVTERNIDYGVPVTDKRYIERGPVFTEEPKPAVFDLSGRSQQNYISMRCVADGFPTPTYEWFKEEYENSRLTARLIDPLSDTRITLTDGTLTIYNPQQTSDRGKYHCKASNRYGTIISETVQLSFGCKFCYDAAIRQKCSWSSLGRLSQISENSTRSDRPITRAKTGESPFRAIRRNFILVSARQSTPIALNTTANNHLN